MTKTPRQQRGSNYETLACAYLQQQGLRLITRNYHCRRGEIDLIMRDRDKLVFVEVRYRRQSRFGSAAESVNIHKQRRLIATAEHYLLLHGKNDLSARFDVIAIDGEQPNHRLNWIQNAFGT